MDAGRLDKRITVRRLSPSAKNEYNENTGGTWSDHLTVWAHKKDVSDQEKISSGQIHSVLMARFTVRRFTETENITTDDMISYNGDWNIAGVKTVIDDKFIEITAIKQ